MGKREPIIKYEETIVPKYTFVEKKREIPVLKELQVEGFGKKEIVDLLSSIKKELSDLQQKVSNLVKYKVREETITRQRVKTEDVNVKNAVIEDVRVKNAVVEDVPVKNAVPKPIAIPYVSDKDIEAMVSFKKAAEDILSKLSEIKNYKIEDEILKREVQVIVPVKKEIPQEKVVFHVKDEVIESLEELVKKLKNK